MNEENFTISENQETVLRLTPIPFSVDFRWKDKQVKVQLNNGEDVLELAKLFSDYLTNNNIPNSIKEI